MRVMYIVLVGIAITPFAASCQIQQPSFGGKGCPDQSLFVNDVNISADDFIEVHYLQSYARAPAYTVRIYANGRLEWHGEAAVRSVGHASASVDAVQATAIIANARTLGFGGLCNEYTMRALDGPRSVTTLKIGDLVKVVTNNSPSSAPPWLYKLNEQVVAFDSVQKLVGVK